jgi:hypothetical protein
MIGTKFLAVTADDLTVLTADELAGVNGGLLTCGQVPVPSTPSGASPSAQGATMAGQWNWGGGQQNGRRTN